MAQHLQPRHIQFDGTSWTTYNTENSGLQSNKINGIAVDSKGYV